MIYFTAHTFKCVCHCRRAMFRVLGMYNFDYGLYLFCTAKFLIGSATKIFLKCTRKRKYVQIAGCTVMKKGKNLKCSTVLVRYPNIIIQ